MNKETFLKIVSHPASISSQEIEALEEVVENFPYCQLAHVLIAKASHDQSSMLASQKLKKAAVYAYNRDALKKLILQPVAAEEMSLSAAASEATPAGSPAPVAPPAPLEEVPLILDMPDSREDQLLSELENTVQAPDSMPADEKRALEKRRQLELIDNFIKTAPRISSLRSDDSTFPDRDLSEKSSSLGMKVVSESLAKIMLKQGKVEKAIEIYQELICKYPEKKAYFAEKIEQLNSNS